MKKSLTKIKLINWMYFTNTTIEIDGNVMITGNNSSGKSTIIDALQLILIGNQKRVRFNVAASDRVARTVEGYVRGQIDEVDKKYLRSGDVTSHIAIEIRSENEVSIFGMVIDISKGSPETRSYHIENCFLTDDLFIEASDGRKSIRPFAAFKSYVERKLKKTITILSTYAELRNKQKEVFGLDPEKYHNLLPKAIGFKSISSVESFVNDFLLDDSKINIDVLQENLQQIERLNRTIKEDESKIIDLNKISAQYYKLQDDRERLSYLKLADKKLLIEKDKTNLDTKIKEIENINFNSRIIDNRYEEINTSLTGYEKELIDIEKDIESNDATETIRQLRLKSNNLGLQKVDAERRLNNLTEKLEKERLIISKLINHDNKELTTTNDYLAKGDFDSSEMFSELGQYQTYLHKIKTKLLSKEKDLERSLNNLQEKQKEYEVVVKKMKRGERPYSKDVNELIKGIKYAIFLKRRRNIDVSPLCEHIDIENEEWREAIEGYLGERKQYLVVEKDDYGDAIEVLESLREKSKINGVGIIDVDKFFEQPKVVKGSLAEHISDNFTNKLAHNYAISVLNEVQCIDATYNLLNYKKAITKETTIYENMLLYRPLRESFELPLIGRNSILIQLKLYEELLLKVENIISKISEEKSSINSLLRNINDSYVSNLLDPNNNLVGSIDEFKKIHKEKNDLDKRLRELEKNSNYITLLDQMEELKLKIGDLKKEQKDLSEEKGRFDERKRIALVEKTTLENGINKNSNDYDLELVTIENIAAYNLLLDKYDYDSMIAIDNSLKENSKSIQEITQVIENSRNVLRQMMNNYTYEYRFNAQTNEEEFYKYSELLKRIQDEDLVKHRRNMEDFKSKNEEYFRQRVLNELKSLIDEAEFNIKTINETLKKLKFGDQQYLIKFGPSEDKEFGEFHDLIMHESHVYVSNNIGDTGAISRYELILNTFMNRLNKGVIEGKGDLRDYRNYINVDIEINTPTGKKYLSKVKHTQSGGEGQVPFYIISAASFQNIMMKGRSKDSRLCIVLFDEAFNNMDAQRVNVMMSYFKILDIQVVLSLTSEKIHSIAKHVDTTIAIVREKEVADVMPFRGTYE